MTAGNLTLRRGEADLVHRDLTTREITLRAETINEDQRSVEAVIATETRATVFDMETFDIIDEVLLIGGVDIPRQMPLLENHNRFSLDSVIGSIRDIHVEGTQLIGRLFFAKGDDTSDRAWNKVRQGHLTDVSTGNRSLERERIMPGQSKTINGRTFTATTRQLSVATKWTPREGSLVPIGADPSARIRNEHRTPSEIIAMNEHLRAYLESIGLRHDADEAAAWDHYDDLSGDTKIRAAAIKSGAIKPTYGEPDPKPAPKSEPQTNQRIEHQQVEPVEDNDAIRAEAAKAERDRIEGIRDLPGADKHADLVKRSIADPKITPDMAARAILEAERVERTSAPQPGAPAAHIRNHERDATRDALAAGLMIRCGLGERIIDRQASDERRRQQEQLAERGDRYRDLALMDLCRESLRLSGQNVPHGREDTIRAAVSTTAMTNIFTTSVNAKLMMSFGEAPDSTQGWTREVDVSDFKANDRIGLGKTGGLEKLPRGGKAAHATNSDKVESYKIGRYAKQFVVDEQDIVDDNLGALMDMPQDFGAAAARLRPDLVYSILLANAALGADGVALFHSTHANTDTNALGAANLKVGVTAMRIQQQNSVNLNLQPQFLVACSTLDFDARELINSTQILIAAAGTTDASLERGTRNTIADLGLQLRTDGRLDNGVIDPDTGTSYSGSTTTWFLASAGNQGRTIEVGFLAGTGRRPQLRSFMLDQGQWGIGWDIKMDIGAKALDFPGLYRGNT